MPWKSAPEMKLIPAVILDKREVQARIQTGFHRFTEIGQIFHNKHIFNNNSSTFQVEIRKMVYRYKCFLFPVSGH